MVHCFSKDFYHFSRFSTPQYPQFYIFCLPSSVLFLLERPLNDLGTALAHELTLRGVVFESEKALPVRYKEQIVGHYEADLVIDGKIIVEIKSMTALHPAHFAQAAHYLAATGLKLALLINFGANKLETKRIVK